MNVREERKFTIALIIGRLPDIRPLSRSFTTNNKFRERIMCAGRAGNSKKGKESSLHLRLSELGSEVILG